MDVSQATATATAVKLQQYLLLLYRRADHSSSSSSREYRINLGRALHQYHRLLFTSACIAVLLYGRGQESKSTTTPQHQKNTPPFERSNPTTAVKEERVFVWGSQSLICPHSSQKLVTFPPPICTIKYLVRSILDCFTSLTSITAPLRV